MDITTDTRREYEEVGGSSDNTYIEIIGGYHWLTLVQKLFTVSLIKSVASYLRFSSVQLSCSVVSDSL